MAFFLHNELFFKLISFQGLIHKLFFFKYNIYIYIKIYILFQENDRHRDSLQETKVAFLDADELLVGEK